MKSYENFKEECITSYEKEYEVAKEEEESG